MSYLVAKNIDTVGCVALKKAHGKQLSAMKRNLEAQIGYEKVQLITISRPSAYGEYEPYHIVDNEEEFEELVLRM